MNVDTTIERRLSTLDHVFTALSKAKAPLDFALIFHFAKAPSFEALNLGAKSARNKYPTTSSFVNRGRWEHLATTDCAAEYAAVNDSNVSSRLIETFIDSPFDLRTQLPYRQLLITHSSGEAILVTRFHHAVADGLSAAMWLGHQLRVAFGFEEPLEAPVHQCIPRLRESSISVRRSKFAYATPSDSLWTSGGKPSTKRRWLSFTFDSGGLSQACKRAGGFTFSDLLTTCALETFSAWNRIHSETTSAQIGLWFPMNIRRNSACGFGNGTSRIRLYPRYDHIASFVEKSREVRRQIKWCTRNGEWVVPRIPLLQSVPPSVLGPALSFYLNRSSVDMATGVFSHADSWVGGAGDVFQTVGRIEAIGLLHPRQAIAINGTTIRGQTNLTLTYDSGLLTGAEANQLAELYQTQITLARKELSHAGQS